MLVYIVKYNVYLCLNRIQNILKHNLIEFKESIYLIQINMKGILD
jgi:hypothetical protein